MMELHPFGFPVVCLGITECYNSPQREWLQWGISMKLFHGESARPSQPNCENSHCKWIPRKFSSNFMNLFRPSSCAAFKETKSPLIFSSCSFFWRIQSFANQILTWKSITDHQWRSQRKHRTGHLAVVVFDSGWNSQRETLNEFLSKDTKT